MVDRIPRDLQPQTQPPRAKLGRNLPTFQCNDVAGTDSVTSRWEIPHFANNALVSKMVAKKSLWAAVGLTAAEAENNLSLLVGQNGGVIVLVL